MKVDYPRVTHPCATLLRTASSPFLVRLACVKHAASVHSEPESNSPVIIPYTVQIIIKNSPDGIINNDLINIYLQLLIARLLHINPQILPKTSQENFIITLLILK